MGIATVSAYTATYLASQLVEENPLDWDSATAESAAFIMWFYAGFGLFWIHASYPNYILSDVDDDGYGEERVLAPLAMYDSDSSADGDPIWELADGFSENLPFFKFLNSDGSAKST